MSNDKPQIDASEAVQLLEKARTETIPNSVNWIAPDPSELEKLLPQFQIYSLIGRGGMGAVYKARQRHLDRIVALKILPEELGVNADFSLRFGREARALARLSHPNLIAIYDFGQTGMIHWIAMEFVEGADLRKVLSMGAMTPREVLLLVTQLTQALQYAHESGVVHRDLKPENILINEHGQVKIGDFGLAKNSHDLEAITTNGQVLGTAHYMAPEQIGQPSNVDHRADIYSLGVIIYEMLTGELPLGQFDPPSQRVTVDARMDEVVLRSLRREPQQRWQTMTDISQVVSDVTQNRNIPPPGTQPASDTKEIPAPLPINPALNREKGIARVWVWLKAFSRSRKKRVLSGFCGGLSDRTPIPAWSWRLLLCLGLLWTPIYLVFIYLLLWMLVPKEKIVKIS